MAILGGWSMADRRMHSIYGRGVGRLTLIIFTALVGSILYLIYNIGPFFYYYYELLNQFQAHIRVASTYTDQEIRDKLLYHIKKLAIPIDEPDDLEISRSGQMMTIRLKYQEVFYITWQDRDYDIYTFDFDAKVEDKF